MVLVSSDYTYYLLTYLLTYLLAKHNPDTNIVVVHRVRLFYKLFDLIAIMYGYPK